jgi:DNA-3-methyladenine glycosylase I
LDPRAFLGLTSAVLEKRRCRWAGSDPLMIAYHDREWGTPVRNDHRLFEFLVLEGAQAGLSWSTILKKRENYRKAFLRFDPKRVARFDRRRKASLLRDPGIVRNRMKVEAAVENARRLLEVREEWGSFSRYVWSFVGNTPIQNRRSGRGVPAKTKESETLSRDLARRGFGFVGPTIVYAFMQAVGMVNDHATDCFRHRELAQRQPRRSKPSALPVSRRVR